MDVGEREAFGAFLRRSLDHTEQDVRHSVAFLEFLDTRVSPGADLTDPVIVARFLAELRRAGPPDRITEADRAVRRYMRFREHAWNDALVEMRRVLWPHQTSQLPPRPLQRSYTPSRLLARASVAPHRARTNAAPRHGRAGVAFPMPQKIDVLVDGGAASAGPPLGPALGPAGVNVMQVVQAINQKTAAFKGMKVPVVVTVNDNKTFEITVGTPPTSALIMKELKIERGSGTPNTAKAGNLSIDQAILVARQKTDDLLGSDLKMRTKEVLGTAVSMGVTCEGKDAREVQREISAGVYDAAFEGAE